MHPHDAERLGTEERLRETQLHANEERLRLALAAGAIGTWDYYPVLGQLMWDERCRDIHGVTSDEPVTYELFRETLHPDDRARVEELIERMLSPASGGHYVVEYRIVRALDHRTCWVSVRGTVLFDLDGLAIRFIGTTQDITEQRRAIETRELLLGVASHDLRGPLSAIKTAADLIGRRVPDVPPKLLDVIQRSTDRMAAMISQLLDLTRIRLRGGVILEPEEFDLAALAAQVVEEAALVHPGPRPVLEVRGECTGRWDRTRLARVLGNLIGNASQHGAHDQPVHVTLLGTASEIRLEVHNRGTIPPEERATLFEPFHRGRITNHEQGLGLGLYITREIVRAHGGRMELLSDDESGTTVIAYLPRAVAGP